MENSTAWKDRAAGTIGSSRSRSSRLVGTCVCGRVVINTRTHVVTRLHTKTARIFCSSTYSAALTGRPPPAFDIAIAARTAFTFFFIIDLRYLRVWREREEA